MKYITISVLLLVLLLESCILGSKSKINTPKHQEIEKFIVDKLEKHEIPGMALAVISEGKVIHKGFYGYCSLDKETPISAKTTFKIFSLTKTLVATSIFQLIQEKKMSIDDLLSKYFIGLPTNWSSVTIANLLTHSSGLPDVRNHMTAFQNDSVSDYQLLKMLFGERMEFQTNRSWNYNQTNYILLKLIIEKLSKQSFDDYILQNQFPNSNPNEVFFSSKPFEQLPNRPHYYHFDKRKNRYIQKPEFLGKKNLPLAGLNLTLDEYIKWNNRLENNVLLSESVKNKMFSKFNFINSSRIFLHGWDVYPVNNHESIGFSGGSVSAYRKFRHKNLSIILLTTGYKNYPVQDMIIEHVASLIEPDLRDEENQLIEQIMSEYFIANKGQDVSLIYENIKKKYPNVNLEKIIKSIGYTLFFDLNRKEEAIALFKLNVKEYGSSFDTHGSLGYLYFITNQFKLSRKYYQNAQQLNPKNPYSKKKLKEIDNMLKNK